MERRLVTAPQFRYRNAGIRRVKVKDILDNPANMRSHPEAQADALAGAVQQVGFFGYPDVFETPDGRLMLVDGELRRHSLLAWYGEDHEIEVNVTDFTPDEANLAMLTKDPIASLAKTNAERLDVLLKQYDANKATLDPSLLNDQQAALDKMLAGLAKQAGSDWGKPQQAVEDEVPEPPAVPVTQRGDLWLLGPYWLCEDCGKEYSYEEGRRIGECPCST